MGQLVEFHYKSIVDTVNGIAYKFKIDSNDLLSEVNYSLSRPSSYFVGTKDSEFIGWVYTVAKNCAVNIFRKETRENTFLVRTDEEDNEGNQNYVGKVFQRDSGQKELLTEITSWIHIHYKHKPHMLQMFEKIFLEDLKYEEIAMELKIPVGTVKTRIHVLRTDITNKFGKQYETLFD